MRYIKMFLDTLEKYIIGRLEYFVEVLKNYPGGRNESKKNKKRV